MANELADVSVSAPQGPLVAPAAPAEAAPVEFPSPFADILAGKVGAVSLAPIENEDMDPVQAYTVENLEKLGAAGANYWEAPGTLESVIFNPDVVTEQQLEEAAKAGKLQEIAPRATDLAPVGAPAPAPGTELAPQEVAGPLAGASVNSGSLERARVKNLTPPPPNRAV